jgi:hypothetical protein
MATSEISGPAGAEKKGPSFKPGNLITCPVHVSRLLNPTKTAWTQDFIVVMGEIEKCVSQVDGIYVYECVIKGNLGFQDTAFKISATEDHLQERDGGRIIESTNKSRIEALRKLKIETQGKVKAFFSVLCKGSDDKQSLLRNVRIQIKDHNCDDFLICKGNKRDCDEEYDIVMNHPNIRQDVIMMYCCAPTKTSVEMMFVLNQIQLPVGTKKAALAAAASVAIPASENTSSDTKIAALADAASVAIPATDNTSNTWVHSKSVKALKAPPKESKKRKVTEDICPICDEVLEINGDNVICMVCRRSCHERKYCSEHLTEESTFSMCKDCLASNCRRCQEPFNGHKLTCAFCCKDFCDSGACLRDRIYLKTSGLYCFWCVPHDDSQLEKISKGEPVNSD